MCLSCIIALGTGSGVGTRVLEILKDEFPEVYRFTTAVFPSSDDDVITSPYNRYDHCLSAIFKVCDVLVLSMTSLVS